MTVDEWADQNRLLGTATSPEPGPYQTSRTPYLREIMVELSPQSRTTTITLIKGAQVGATELGVNWIGCIVDRFPQPIMMVVPSIDMLRKNSKTRIQPMFDNTPCLIGKVASKSSKEDGNSMDLKMFRGGLLALATAGSAISLRSQPVRALFLDEMSAYDSDVDGEGDPVELAKARCNNFGRKKKILQASTPTVRGACRIEQEFAKSDKRYYNIPCIHCGHKFPIVWSLIRFEKDEDNKLINNSVHLECPQCKKRIDEHHKTWFMAEDNGAEWIPTAIGEDGHKGYHLSSLYSPLGWNSWTEIAQKWITANELKTKGDYTALKTFVNTQLGETWEDPASRINEAELWSHREDWLGNGYEVPDGGVCITVGADVQKNRIEASVYAWGENEECWGISHKVFFGDPTDIDDPVWEKMDELIYKTKFKHQSGALLPVTIACVDSGNWADVVYQYVLRNKQRGVFAVKGQGREDHPIIKRSKNYIHGKKKVHIALFHVGTFEAKRMLSLRVQATKENRMIHYPIAEDFDEEFFKQLASEYMVTKYVKGFPRRHFELPSGYRNETLDCWVYALAAKRIYDPSIKLMREQLGLSKAVDEVDEPIPVPTFMEQKQQERRTNWKRPQKSYFTGRR